MLVCDKLDVVITCAFVIFTSHLCFLDFYKKICLKEDEVWQKLLSLLSLKVCCLLSSPVLLRKLTDVVGERTTYE